MDCWLFNFADEISYEDFVKRGAMVIEGISNSIESHKTLASHFLTPIGIRSCVATQREKIRESLRLNKRIGLIPQHYTFIINKIGVARHIFTSEINRWKHIEEALRILQEIVH